MRLFYVIAFASIISGCNGGSDTLPSTPSAIDTKAPVLTLAGDEQVTIEFDTNYVDEGATAIDDVDGDVDVLVSGQVDTSSVGIYQLTFTASDKSGNSSFVTRTVNVVNTSAPLANITVPTIDTTAPTIDPTEPTIDATVPTIDTTAPTIDPTEPTIDATVPTIDTTTPTIDTTAPVLALIGDKEINIEFNEVYVDAGATATDNVDDELTVTLNSSVNTSIIDVYELVYSAIDSSGNTSSTTRTVNVVDTIAPVITLTGDSEITVGVGEIYIDEGATVLDNADSEVTLTLDGTVNSSIIGEYELVYSTTDNSGNTSSATRTVNVVDTIGPVITLTGAAEITVEIGEIYIDAGATASDNIDGDLPVIVDGEVNTSTIGLYQLTYTVIDSSGNSSSITRDVTVIEQLTTIAGKVIDGYVSGATVWLDYNGNGNFDKQTEPSTISGEAGDYSFEFTEEQKLCLPYSTMFVDVPVGAMDADTGIVTDAYQMALPPSIDTLPDDELRHISPLTSSIWGGLQSQLQESGKSKLSCADLIDDIALQNEIKVAVESVILNAVTYYNLSEDQLFADFILDDNSVAYDAAQKIVRGLKAAFRYTLDLNKQYPDANEIRVVVYQSTENDERYNLVSAWYRDVVIFLEDKTLVEDVKLKETDALDQVEYVLTKLERVDSAWGDQRYYGELSIRNDIYINDDLSYRCGIIETVSLENNGITYDISNTIPSVNHPTIEACTPEAIDSPYERSFRVSYTIDDSNYFGVFYFREDKEKFNDLPNWINVVANADTLEPNDVFEYMNTLPYEFNSVVELDASYWRKRKTSNNVWVDTNNDNDWVRTTRLADNTRTKECSDDGENWGLCE